MWARRGLQTLRASQGIYCHSRTTPKTLLGVLTPRYLSTDSEVDEDEYSMPEPLRMEYGSNKLQGHIVGPEGAPGVVVVHEMWGVTTDVLQHASFMSCAQFRCLVPDIYKGQIGENKVEAERLMEGLDHSAALADIEQAAEHLLAEGCPRVGVIGFGMGSALAWLSASSLSNISCAVACYGIPDPAKHPGFTSQLRVPVQAHHGEQDTLLGFSDPSTARGLQGLLDAGGKSNEFHFYEGAGHAFLNPTPRPFNSWEERQEVMGFPRSQYNDARMLWRNVWGFMNDNLTGPQ